MWVVHKSCKRARRYRCNHGGHKDHVHGSTAAKRNYRHAVREACGQASFHDPCNEDFDFRPRETRHWTSWDII